MNAATIIEAVLGELIVENYAVVERARIRLHPGFNVLTGETGSGKSIVVDALGLLFGERASSDVVRAGAARARIAGIFEIPNGTAARAALESAGIEIEDGELLIEREILANGKSRAFAGSRPVAAGYLRELAPLLGDIHGQHDSQQLFSADVQRSMLDAFAGAGAAVAELGALYRGWKTAAREAEEFERGSQERLRMADLWRFQLREIETAALQPGEDAALENERAVLRNIGKLQDAAAAAYAALYDAPENAFALLRTAAKKVDELARIDGNLQTVADALRPVEIAVSEAAGTLRDYLDRLEADPQRLEGVESRLALVERLKRKYGGSLDEILAFLEEARAQLATVDDEAGRRAELAARVQQAADAYSAAALKMTAVRQQASAKLSKAVERELGALAMQGTAFRIGVEPAPWSEHGADAVQFLIAANAGEELKPLSRVASGGELSRVALALRTSLGKAARAEGGARALVFDEIDTGIGGAVAESIGRRLKSLAAGDQVLCVTHLAQIASFADHHYAVEKREAKGRTVASVEELTAEQRTREIGRMLSGERVTEEALRNAARMLEASAGVR